MFPRAALKPLQALAAAYPIVTISGPRQSGKTTLAQAAFPSMPYVSLDDSEQREMASGDPEGFLGRFPEGAVIDEAQRSPELLSHLKARVERDRRAGQFVLTGSQQFGLLSRVRQSWAGLAGMQHLLPLSLAELKAAGVPVPDLAGLMLKGLYPPLYDRPLAPQEWYAEYALAYAERELHRVLAVRDLSTFQLFLRMCAARTAQLLNLSSLASDCGISHNTARSWLSVLEAGYLVFLLQPHTRNFGKRLVKKSKLYFLDTGLAARMLNVQDAAHLAIHPQRAALFESLVVAELLKARFNRGLPPNLFFWRTNTGIEVDLLLEQGQTLIPVEIKSGQTIASDFTWGLEKWRSISGSEAPAYLVYGGASSLNHKGMRVLSWSDLSELDGR